MEKVVVVVRANRKEYPTWRPVMCMFVP